MPTDAIDPNRVGAQFNEAELLRTRDISKQLLFALAKQVRPGMREADAHDLYPPLLREFGIQRHWHPPKIRFGPNTRCSFREVSQDYSLKENDIFFFDLGPIVGDHEGDFGHTFCCGHFPEGESVIRVAQEIFAKTRNEFLEKSSTGVELYKFAENLATEAGYSLVNEGANGHRISEFPHTSHYIGNLRGMSGSPVKNRWILEIQIIDHKNSIGAFFEDILT